MTAGDGAAKDADGDRQAGHSASDHPTDPITRAHVGASLKQGLRAVDLPKLVGFPKRRTEGKRGQVAKVGRPEPPGRVRGALEQPLSPG
jgi:hypothetical protein